jgi:hypothetical protein
MKNQMLILAIFAKVTPVFAYVWIVALTPVIAKLIRQTSLAANAINCLASVQKAPMILVAHAQTRLAVVLLRSQIK